MEFIELKTRRFENFEFFWRTAKKHLRVDWVDKKATTNKTDNLKISEKNLYILGGVQAFNTP